MKDTGKRIISSILACSGIGILGFYLYQGMPLVKDYVMQYNYYVLALLAAVFLVFFLQFGLLVLPGKWLKVRSIILGIVVILVGYYFINNDASKGMYAGDITALIGVLMIYLSLTGLIVTKKAEEKEALKKQVIIEV